MEKPITITIVEKRSRDVTINAVTVDEALDMVEGLYQLGDIELDRDDFEDVDFICYEEEDPEL